MDFSSITRRNRTLGRILRFPLNLIPKETIVPILQGQLRGKKWIVGASVHACWLGSYEMEKQELIAKHLKDGDVFYDIGANVGLFTLLAATKVGSTGHVYAFEPFPRNIPYIQKHMELNDQSNYTLYEQAVGKSGDAMMFEAGPQGTHTMGKLSQTGTLSVKVSSLDALTADDNLRPPQVIKIDVEGGEYGVLQGARNLLSTFKPLVFLATHAPEIHEQCTDFLKELGYDLQEFPSVDGGGELLAQVSS